MSVRACATIASLHLRSMGARHVGDSDQMATDIGFMQQGDR